MAAEIQFYGPITIYVRREDGEWWAHVDPFSVSGDGSTKERAIDSALRNLTELLHVLADDIRKHGPQNVEVLCPLKPGDKKGATPLQGLLWAATAPIRKRMPSFATRVKRIDRASARKMLAVSASIGVIPPPIVLA